MFRQFLVTACACAGLAVAFAAPVAVAADGLPQGKFVDIRAELERRASAGDNRAAVHLADVLLNCNAFRPMTDAQIEALFVDSEARLAEAGRPREGAPLDNLTDMRDGMRWRQQLCVGAEGARFTREDGLAAIDWLHQAARRGDADAMVKFIGVAFAEFDGIAGLVARGEEVRARKAEVKDYLQRALAAGNVEALQAYATHYTNGMVLAKDPAQAYLYAVAYAQKSAGDAAAQRRLKPALDFAARGLTPDQIAQARTQGTALYASCCAAKRESR